ncbi:MAG: hypothetical protein WCP24_02090 [bacterium]
MLPEENKNNIGQNTFKVDIDPVFKGNNGPQRNAVDQVNPAGAYEVLSNQEYIPTQAPTTSAPSNPNINKTPKTVVRTYKDDLESAIQNNHLSSINIAIAENQKLHSQINNRVEVSPSGNNDLKSKIIISLSLILVLGGVVGISAFYFINKKSPAPVIKTQELTSLITTEYKDELNVDTIIKNRFINVLSSKLNDIQTPINTLYNTYVTTGSSTTRRLTNTSEFISLMKFQMSDTLKRTLLPSFMVGMYSFDRNLPFVILKTSSFENAYSGMLSWESYLQKDFREIFRLPGYGNSIGIINDLTPTSIKKFEDGVILNKDVRILRDDSRNIILLYGIIDKETIVITVNDFVFKEIINRLNKEKTLQR